MYPEQVTAGFMLEVADYLEKYQTDLIAKKLDPTDDITALRLNAAELTKQNGVQEGLKTQLKDQTTKVTTLNGGGYDAASTALDSAVGKLGKKTTQGQEGSDLRTKLRGKESKAKTKPTP